MKAHTTIPGFDFVVLIWFGSLLSRQGFLGSLGIYSVDQAGLELAVWQRMALSS